MARVLLCFLAGLFVAGFSFLPAQEKKGPGKASARTRRHLRADSARGSGQDARNGPGQEGRRRLRSRLWRRPHSHRGLQEVRRQILGLRHQSGPRQESLENVAKEKMEKLVTIELKDIFELDLKNAT